MKVNTKTLFFLAGIVWLIAGGNVAYIGLQSYDSYLTLKHFIFSTIIFIVFLLMFSHIVQKHTLRIQSYQKAQPIYRFFDGPSFLMMALMMSLGISLRAFHIVSFEFIAIFYTGLGLALCLAGIQFLTQFIKVQI